MLASILPASIAVCHSQGHAKGVGEIKKAMREALSMSLPDFEDA